MYILILFCNNSSAIGLEKYPVWQFTMQFISVIQWNFLNTIIIVNYPILIILNWSEYHYISLCSNWQNLQHAYEVNRYRYSVWERMFIYVISDINLVVHPNFFHQICNLVVQIREGEMIDGIKINIIIKTSIVVAPTTIENHS